MDMVKVIMLNFNLINLTFYCVQCPLKIIGRIILLPDNRRSRRSVSDYNDTDVINLSYSVQTVASECRVWDSDSDSWTTEGCSVRICNM